MSSAVGHDSLAGTSLPLEVRGLQKRYDDVLAVDSVDLDLADGELLALVGPSGCGKSTLLRSIAGLIAPDEGTIRLAGELVDDGKRRLAPEDRSTGLVFQEHALFPHLTVSDNVSFGLRGDSRSSARRRVAEMLELVDLGGYESRFPHELSGGERQRVSLARAMAPDPDIMLFDEPFASLDQNLRLQLRQQVAWVLRQTSTPAVFVTHDQQEALALGDRIAVMRSGKIVQSGSASEVFHQPVDRFVASFMGDANFLPVESTSNGTRTVLGAIDLQGAATADVVSLTRPDDLVLVTDDEGTVVVVDAEYAGTHWVVTAQLDGAARVKLLTSHLETPVIGQRGSLALVDGHHQVVVPLTAD